MTADDVLEVHDALERVGVSIWLDGGWGIDALFARQTRPHDDLDAVLNRRDLALAQTALAPLGFRHAAHVRPGLPARLVLRDVTGRQVDFHPVAFDSDGNGHQDLGHGRSGLYPVEGLGGIGAIAGRPVRCITPQLQLLHHLGYEPTDRDREDVQSLAEHFGLALPPPYGLTSE
jgi:lincosamide nucleotidyltransferase A/C/D/E